MFSIKLKKKSLRNNAQFSRRPSLDERPTLTVPTEKQPIWAQGYCYWVEQLQMRFGQNRKIPVSKRPAVAFPRKQDGLWIIFPATTQASRQFFHLQVNQCSCPKRNLLKDSYLFYRYETVSQNALRQHIGSLHHSTAMEIAKWYQKHYLAS